MKALFALAAVAAVSSPAFAEPRAPKPVTENAAQDGIPAPRAREQRVCLVDTITGSRIPKRECRTRSDWASRNVDLKGL